MHSRPKTNGKNNGCSRICKNEYDCFIEFNFILDENAKKIFDGSLDANTLIEGMTALARKEFIPGKTLILFDEIQECPNARTAIKFLVQDGRFDYVETGSLLGIKNKNVKSYPVGFEELYNMHPMDFEEFLLANGIQTSTIDILESCYHNHTEVPDLIHTTINKLFYSYIVVGGMPRIVQTYIDTHDIGKVIAEQKDILELYRQDISKYSNNNDKAKIRAIFDSVPSQLNDKNRRFNISSINSSARLLRYEDSFNWLIDAGVVNPCYNVSEPKSALKLNEKRNLFKLYLADTGLLCAESMDNIQFELLQGNLSINMGSILENVMGQMLVANGFDLNYFDSPKYGKLDFVLQNGTSVDYIEIKSGNDYKKHNASNKIMSVNEWSAKNIIVFCKDNVQEENNILYLPWYMAIFYKHNQINTELIYKVDLQGL